MSALIQLDALGHRGPYRTRHRIVVPDVTGAPAAELSLVPRLFVGRAVAALRAARPLPAADRIAALRRAAAHFTGDEIAGLSFADYERRVSRISGVPLPVVRAATAAIAEAATVAGPMTDLARPVGAVADWRGEPTRSGSAVWTRRGEV